VGSHSFENALINEASVFLRNPPPGSKRSGIDYRRSFLEMVDYCENKPIANAPYNFRFYRDGKNYGTLLSSEEAKNVRNYIDNFVA